MVVFQALTWEARDVDEEHLISVFGRSSEGKSVCVTTSFNPYYFVRLPPNSSVSSIAVLYKTICKATRDSPDSYDIVHAKDLWGFQNNKKVPFLKLNFTTHKDMRISASILSKPFGEARIPLKLYESNLEPVLRFMHRTGIQSTGWLDTGTDCVRSHLTRTNIDMFCNDWRTLGPVVRDDVAPFIVASFDIETNSSTGKFPDADIDGDCAFQAAFTLRRVGESEMFDKTCLCYKQTSPLEGNTIVSYDTEREFLVGVKDYILKHDIDIITGWNIFGFDLEYLAKRSIVCGCSDEFMELGKLKDTKSEMVYKRLSSSALGDNMLKLLPMSGRYIFDLFHEVKKDQKLDSYALNNVAKVLLGDQKIDMPPKEMFKRFREGDPDKLVDVAEYCIKDTLLPHYIMDKLCNLLNLLEMAKATWVPISYLSERGQQIKVFSQIARQARDKGYMVPHIRSNNNTQEGYEGATVLEAQTGAYYEPITALDFEGLYPSIMMAHNLCYSTLVIDPRYDNIPGVKYESFEIGSRTFRFAQDVPSLLPGILADLKSFRKQAKKEMAKSSGTMRNVYNGKQLAYKVSMNSVYGFTGATHGMLPCVAIAATTTAEGRHMIDQTKEHVEANFPGAVVRYGDTDSVMVQFDVEGRTGEEAIAYSWKLGEEAATMCNSLFKKPKNLELEKVYCPYFLYSKKRYAAKMWTQDRNGQMKMDCIDVKGLQLVRRDNIPFVREVSKEILDVILESENPDGARKVARDRAVELLDGRVSMEKLTLSQKLADSYKSTSLPHVRVRDKIREREPGSEPQSGDRVPFVLIDTGDPGHKQFEKAEDPTWAKNNDLPLDYRYYFTNKFMNPVCDLLAPLIPNPQEVIFGDFIPKKKPRKKPMSSGGERKIEDLFAMHRLKQKSVL